MHIGYPSTQPTRCLCHLPDKKIVCVAGLLFLLLNLPQVNAQVSPFGYRIQKKVNARNGVVVSAHALASKTGTDILRQGGNAIDAAIATQWALAVVYPGAGNIGGGGFLVAVLSNGKKISIDYRETAPEKATKDMYVDTLGKAQPQLAQDGHLAAGVPGTVAGLFASLAYARLPMPALMAPAIALAEKGFVLTRAQAEDFNEYAEDFRRFNSTPVPFVKEGGWKAGDTLVQPDLAATLKRISQLGSAGFYEGETARLIEQEMKKGRGLISREDLSRYQAVNREPVSFLYRGHEIVSMPLPSSGGILLQQMLGMIEEHPIHGYPFHSAQQVQLMVEAERRAFADRAAFLGDADFVTVPIKGLTSKKYLSERMRDFVPGKAGNSRETGAGVPPESEETTHLSVVDRWGNAVAVTTTLNGHFGSRVVVAGAGFILNNEMDDFSIQPGVPNMYGAVGNEKNSIAPGKRMLSSMTPTIVLKGGRPLLVTGTPGGTTIPTSVLQTLVNVIDYKLSPEEAVNRPKFHHQWLPDLVYVEKDFDSGTVKALEKMGYVLKKREAIGRTELIMIRGKELIGVADKRGEDDAEGY
jgi:gamma-glutamyltranspeptidase/glutathione hydrolase